MERITDWRSGKETVETLAGGAPYDVWLRTEMVRLERSGRWHDLHVRRRRSRIALFGRYIDGLDRLWWSRQSGRGPDG